MASKVVLAHYNIKGWTKGTDDDTLIDPEDILSDESGEDSPTFVKGEELELKFDDIPFTAKGKVIALHEDEYGYLVQVRINQSTLRPADVS